MRILLYVATNLAVVLLLGVVLHVFGVEAWLLNRGVNTNLGAILGFAAVFGFGGSLISLALSKTIAKMTTGAKVITTPADVREEWLLDTVGRLAQQAGVGMPEVAIFPSAAPNAFATGMWKNKALVAVSQGLLENMRPDEIEAVLGHEMSHVANGDMVTMSLLQGVLNTFVIFLSRVVAMVVDSALGSRSDRGRGGVGYFITTMALQIVFGIAASWVVSGFSRWREYRADRGGAKLAGRDDMIAALRRLESLHTPSGLPESLAAFGIKGERGEGFLAALRHTHPPIEKRIAALEALPQE
jgi:heat shock protein HtpX